MANWDLTHELFNPSRLRRDRRGWGRFADSELPGRSWVFNFDFKVGLFFGVLSLPFDVKGLVMDLCLTQHAFFQGAPVQSPENTTVLVAQIFRMQQERSICDRFCGYGPGTPKYG